MTTTFNEGDRVYLIDGTECEFVAYVGEKLAVHKVYTTDDDGEETPERLGDVILVREAFASPPTEKRHAEVARLESALSELRAKIADARREETELAAAAKQRDAALAEHRAVARVVDFIAGKITHFAIRDYSDVSVVTRDEAIRYVEQDRWGGRWDGRTLKLLTLYGHDIHDHRNGRGLSWRINRYSDGSGGSFEVMPCQSREEALEVARGWLDEDFAKFDGKVTYGAGALIKSADALGIPVPAAYRAAVKQHAIDEAQRSVDCERAQMEAAQKKLDELRAALGEGA